MSKDRQTILLKKTTALLLGTRDFRNLAREVTSLIVKELRDQNVIGAAVFRLHSQENLIYAYTYANKYRRIIDSLLPGEFSQLNVSLSQADNYIVKAVLTNHIQHSEKLADFSRGVLPEGVSVRAQKIMKARFFVAFPIRLKSNKVAGVILLALSDARLSGEQLVFFETLAGQLGLAFSNVLEFERLMARFQNLSSGFVSSAEDKPSVKFTLRVTRKENAKLEKLAKERKRTKAEVIRELLEKE